MSERPVYGNANKVTKTMVHVVPFGPFLRPVLYCRPPKQGVATAWGRGRQSYTVVEVVPGSEVWEPYFMATGVPNHRGKRGSGT